MKKITAIAAVAILATSALVSCGNSTPKPSLKNDIDTFSYAIGMAQTQGLKEYLTQMEIDTAYMSSFIKGLNDGVNAGDNKKKAAYFMGVQIGQQISGRMIKGINQDVFGGDTTKTISLKNFMAGFIAGTTGKPGVMTVEQAQQTVQAKAAEIKRKNMEEQYGTYKKEQEKWLAENGKKAGVKTLPSGVQYKPIKEGTGPMPKDTSMVEVHYTGYLTDGTEFDSSYKRGEKPVEMRLNQVIKGWTEALTHMPVGSEWMIYVPASLGYGENGAGQIKPFSTLIFKIKLISIK